MMLCLPLQFEIPISCNAHHIIRKKAGAAGVSLPQNEKFNGLPSCVVKSRLARTSLPESSCSAYSGTGNEMAQGLDPTLVPKHVAVFIDGFRRWGKTQGLTTLEAYEDGTRRMIQVADKFYNCGVKTVSVFVLHQRAWDRPKEDIDFLLKLSDEIIQENIEEVMRKDIRITGLGNKSRFPPSLLELAQSVEERTKNNKGPHIVLAADYSGRYDITQAAKKIAGKVKDGVLDAEDIDEALFEQHLETNVLEYPNPDLLIRTGGKFKLSNFMLWQLAYSELYVSDKLLPDFNEEDVVQALAEYQRRQRRFGAD